MSRYPASCNERVVQLVGLLLVLPKPILITPEASSRLLLWVIDDAAIVSCFVKCSLSRLKAAQKGVTTVADASI